MLQLSINIGVLLQLFTRKICTVLKLIERFVIGLFNGQFRFSENLMYEKKFVKVTFAESLWCTTIFCVTRKMVAGYN